MEEQFSHSDIGDGKGNTDKLEVEVRYQRDFILIIPIFLQSNRKRREDTDKTLKSYPAISHYFVFT